MTTTDRAPLFPLGRRLTTPGALDALERECAAGSDGSVSALVLGLVYLARHRRGDWGDLGDDDKQANEEALTDGARILSAYKLVHTGERLWIITEACDDIGQRAATTILLPDEY